MLDGISPISDPDLERALVALIFRDEKAIARVGSLTAEDLTDPQLSAVVAAALDLHSKRVTVNAVTLLPRLRGIATIDGETGLDVVRSLTVGGRTPPVEDVAARLHDLATRRRLSEYLQNVANSATDESLTPNAVVADATAHLPTLVEQEETEVPTVSLGKAASDFIAYLQSDVPATEITTGFVDLDEAIGGWHRGQFAILAGRPSMGKSTVALSSMIQTAKAGHGVLFFSLEMPAHQLAARALTDISYTPPPIEYSSLRPKQSNHFLRRLTEASEHLRGLPLEVETRASTVDVMSERVRKAVETFKAKGKSLDLVVVDHLLKVLPSERYAGSRVEELGEVSEGMCRIAKTFNVAVLALHQLNRSTEGRENQRALISDLRGSGNLEQDADVVLLCFRPAYRYERLEPETDEERITRDDIIQTLKYDMEIQVAKQRQGATTNVDLWCDLASNAVRNKDWRR
jgi:replicative DNA helicase